MRQRDRPEDWKCQPTKWLSPELEMHEIKIGCISLLLGSLISGFFSCYVSNGGWTTLYYDISKYGWFWFFAQIPIIFIWQVWKTTKQLASTNAITIRSSTDTNIWFKTLENQFEKRTVQHRFIHLKSHPNSLEANHKIEYRNLTVDFEIKDYLTYWHHRWYHVPFLYKNFHKLHHTYKQPTAFSVTAIHPVEFLHIQAVLMSPMFLFPTHWCTYIWSQFFFFIIFFNIYLPLNDVNLEFQVHKVHWFAVSKLVVLCI